VDTDPEPKRNKNQVAELRQAKVKFRTLKTYDLI
jgi:hypothetical protein